MPSLLKSVQRQMQKFSLNTVLKYNERFYFCNYLFTMYCVCTVLLSKTGSSRILGGGGSAALPAPSHPARTPIYVYNIYQNLK